MEFHYIPFKEGLESRDQIVPIFADSLNDAKQRARELWSLNTARGDFAILRVPGTLTALWRSEDA